jgi:Dyp-type peroxidase family
MGSIADQLHDIQGNILRAYGFPFARYEVLRIVDRLGARRLLRSVLEQQLIMSARAWDPQSKPSFALNVFLSWPGLAALGLPQAALDSFPEEFRLGMAARAKRLGDVGRNAPATWEFGQEPDRNHVFFALYGRTMEDRERMLEKLRRELDAVGPAVEVTHQLNAQMLGNHKEHFGYADGIGQPSIKDSGTTEYPGEGTLVEGKWVPLAAGEFVLGYPGETGFAIPMPQPDVLGRNGSFLVYRLLEQHVAAFRAFLTEQARRVYQDSTKEELVAAKLVGRWRSGCPVALRPDKDDEELARDWMANNAFGYANDAKGAACPLGSHIRRMNPRDGRIGDTLVRTHRIVRRGLPYGPWLPEGAQDDGQRRGVAFMAINASIRYQFEFLQSEWINNGEFAGLSKADVDPFGGEPRTGSRFQVVLPDGRPKNIFDLPPFVTLKGGGYYFIPSLSALRFIAEQTS